MGIKDQSLVSSTDSAEDVAAALNETPAVVSPTPIADAAVAAKAETDKAVADKAAADKVVADKAVTDAAEAAKVADPEAPAAGDETAEQKAARASKSARERRSEKIQREIDTLTAKRHDTRRDAEAEESRLTSLRAQAAQLDADIALRQVPAGTPAAAGVDGAAPKPKLLDVKADGQPVYANYEEWVDAVGEWHGARASAAAEKARDADKKEQAITDRARIEHATVSRAEQNALASYDTHLEEFKTRTPDFDAVLTAAREAVQEIVDDMGDHALSVIDRYTVHDADNGPAIVHYLSQNPDEMRAIAELSVPRQLAALGKLDFKLASATPPPARTPKPAVSRAPEPMTPVGGSPTSSTVSAEDESYPAYKLRRAAEERAAKA